MSNYTIIPSNLKYKAAPSVDQEISISLEEKSQQMIEYDRSSTVSLAQVFDNERQESMMFRPTFKITYLYDNTYTGTTSYLPFQYNLYYVNPETSNSSTTWKGFPQYYEFDFFRPDVSDQHIVYKAKSAYTYNWMYYLSYAYNNNYDKKLSTVINSIGEWTASEGIPFSISIGWGKEITEVTEEELSEVTKFVNEFFDGIDPEDPSSDIPKCVDTVTIKRL